MKTLKSYGLSTVFGFAILAIGIGMLLSACGELEVCDANHDCACVGTNGTCEHSCDGAGCNFACDNADACIFHCEGGNCNVSCSSSDSCTVDCPGGGCTVGCSSMNTCKINSCDQECDLTCSAVDTCTNSCSEDTGCDTTDSGGGFDYGDY